MLATFFLLGRGHWCAWKVEGGGTAGNIVSSSLLAPTSRFVGEQTSFGRHNRNLVSSPGITVTWVESKISGRFVLLFADGIGVRSSSRSSSRSRSSRRRRRDDMSRLGRTDGILIRSNLKGSNVGGSGDEEDLVAVVRAFRNVRFHQHRSSSCG